MSSAFNLTAQINLRGPANIRTVVADIRRQLGTVTVDINPQINANAARNITQLSVNLRNLNATLDATVISARNASRAITNLGTAINNIGGRNVQQNMAAVTATTQNLTRNLTSVNRGAQLASTQMEEFGRQSALAIRRFAAFSIVTSTVYSFINALSKGVDEFIKFDKEFVRLQQVTGESAKGLQSLASEITRLSTQYGVASNALTQVSVTLAQAGLTAGDTKRALEALAQSALSPSFDDMNETVEGSIALMRQFGISATDLGKSLGSVSAVSAQFAVEASDIITAIQRTGGVFATASKGVSQGADALNEFIALFTSVRQTTRESAETIATGLRTIFTRIQRGSTIDALKEFGVTLTDLEGKFVGPFEAIKRLSIGLKELDPRDLRFSAIVEELGGFRQIGKVIPLIQQFTVAQQALKVAQQGQGILAKDAATAQLSLANQIAKVREEFLALVRSIGESDSFRSFVGLSLQLASALIRVADAAKDVLPAIAAISTIKGISALTQFGAGFTRGLTRPRGFATGGYVPGSGNRDTVPAMLTPGEFVIRKKAVETIGADKLHAMNKYAGGGSVQKFAGGRLVMPKGRGTPGARGSRSRFKDLTEEELAQLSTDDLIRYAKAQARDIFSAGGAGMATSSKFIPVPKERITPELESSLTTYLGQKGFWKEVVSPFGKPNKMVAKAQGKLSREEALKKQQSRLSDEVAARAQQWTSIRSGSSIDNYLLSSLQEPILSDYRTVRGGGSLSKPFYNTRLRQSVNKALENYDDFDYSSANIDKLVSDFAAKKFASGGLVQKFVDGKYVQRLSKEGEIQRILSGLKGGGSNITRLIRALPEQDQKILEMTIERVKAAGATGLKQASLTSKKFTEKLSGNPQIAKDLWEILVGAKKGQRTLTQQARLKSKQESQLKEAATTSGIKMGLVGIQGEYSSKPRMLPAIRNKQTGEVIQESVPATIETYAMDPAIAKISKKIMMKYQKKMVEELAALYAQTAGTTPMDIKTAKGKKRLERIIKKESAWMGNALESAMAVANPELYNPRNKSLDQPAGLGALSRLFTDTSGRNISPDMPIDYAFTASQETVGRKLRKGQFSRAVKEFRFNRKALGGSIQDTVPALLTPGEFVINKKAASRIGASRLHNLNRADKIQGFNKGGAVGHVQKMAVGGEIGASLGSLSSRESARLEASIQRNVAAFDRLEQMVRGWPMEQVANAAKNLARSLDKGGMDVDMALQKATTSSSWGDNKQNPKIRGGLGLALDSTPETRTSVSGMRFATGLERPQLSAVGPARTFSSFTGLRGEDLTQKALIRSGSQAGQIQKSYLDKITQQASDELGKLGASSKATDQALLVFRTQVKATGNAQVAMEAATRVITQSYKPTNPIFQTPVRQPGFAERASNRASAYQNRADQLGISFGGDINAVMASFNRGLAGAAKALGTLTTASNYSATNLTKVGTGIVRGGLGGVIQGIGGSALSMMGLGRFSTAGRRAAAAAASGGAAGGAGADTVGMGGGMGGMLPYMLPVVGGLAVDSLSQRYGGETTEAGRNISSIGSSVINYGSTGAMIGSLLGPWGTAAGAAAGAAYGLYEGLNKAKEASLEYSEKIQAGNVERVVSENSAAIGSFASDPTLKNRAAALKALEKISAEEDKINVVRSKTDTNSSFAQRVTASQQSGANAAVQFLNAEIVRTGKTYSELASSLDPSVVKNIVEADETYYKTRLEYNDSIQRQKEAGFPASSIAALEKEKNAALSALTKEIINRVTAESRAAIEAEKTAKQQAMLQQAVERVMQTYADSFNAFDQILSSSSASIDQINQRLSKIASGLTGFSATAGLEENINILRNPKAFSEEQRNIAFTSASSSFPGMEKTFKQIADYSINAEKAVRENLKKIDVSRISGGEGALEEEQIKVIEDTFNKQINEVFKGDETLKRAVDSILKDAREDAKKGFLDIDKVIKQIVESTGGQLGTTVENLLIKSQQQLIDTFDKIKASAQVIANINQEIIDRNAAFTAQTTNNSMAYREALGERISPQERLRLNLSSSAQRLGIGLAPGQTLNANMIADRRSQLEEQRSTTQQELAKLTPDLEKNKSAINQLQQELAKLDSAIETTNQELEKFGNTIQSSIDETINKIADRAKVLEENMSFRREDYISQITSTPQQRTDNATIQRLTKEAISGNYSATSSPGANRAYNEFMAPYRQEMAGLQYIGAQWTPQALQELQRVMIEGQKVAEQAFAQEIEQIVNNFQRTNRDPEDPQQRAQLAQLLQNLGKAQGIDPALIKQVAAEAQMNAEDKANAAKADQKIIQFTDQLKELYQGQVDANKALNEEAKTRQAAIQNEVVAPTLKAITENTNLLGVEIKNLSTAINTLAVAASKPVAVPVPASAAPSPPVPAVVAGGAAKGGLIYANKGMLVNYQPKGIDTVPAMLAEGEFVINRDDTKKNLGLLRAINAGQDIKYAAGGGRITNPWTEAPAVFAPEGSQQVTPGAQSVVESLLGNTASAGIGAAKSIGPSAIGTKVGVVTTAATAPFIGPFAVPAGIATGTIAGIGSYMLQDAALDTIAPETNQAAKDITANYPVGAMAGSIAAGGLNALKPIDPKTIKYAARLSGAAKQIPKTPKGITSALDDLLINNNKQNYKDLYTQAAERLQGPTAFGSMSPLAPITTNALSERAKKRSKKSVVSSDGESRQNLPNKFEPKINTNPLDLNSNDPKFQQIIDRSKARDAAGPPKPIIGPQTGEKSFETLIAESMAEDENQYGRAEERKFRDRLATIKADQAQQDKTARDAAIKAESSRYTTTDPNSPLNKSESLRLNTLAQIPEAKRKERGLQDEYDYFRQRQAKTRNQTAGQLPERQGRYTTKTQAQPVTPTPESGMTQTNAFGKELWGARGSQARAIQTGMNDVVEPFKNQLKAFKEQDPRFNQLPAKQQELLNNQLSKLNDMTISKEDIAKAAGPQSVEQFAAQERINKAVDLFAEEMKRFGKPVSEARKQFLKFNNNTGRMRNFEKQDAENRRKAAEEAKKAQEAEAAKKNKPPEPPKPGEEAPKPQQPIPAPPPPQETQPKPPISSTPSTIGQTIGRFDPVPADVANSINTGFSNFTNQTSLFGESISTFDRSVASFRDSVNNIRLSQNPTNQTSPSNSTNITNVVGNMNWTIPADISNQLNTLTTIKLDPASITRLDVFKTDFNKIVQSLANLNINIPAKIEMFGIHQVNVTIDAPALENMIPGIESMVASSVSSKMEQIWNQSGGELGPTPTMYG